MLTLTPSAPARTRALLSLIATLVLGVFAAPAPAQFDGGGFGGDEVAVSVQPRHEAVPAGETSLLAVVIDHKEGWHTYPPNNTGPEAVVGSLLPVTVEVQGLITGDAVYPEAKLIPVPQALLFGELANQTPPPTYGVFSNRAVVLVPVRVPADASGTIDAQVTVSWQACDDITCLPPTDQTFTVSLEVGEHRDAGVDAALFAGADQIDLAVVPETGGVPADPAAADDAGDDAAEQGAAAPGADAGPVTQSGSSAMFGFLPDLPTSPAALIGALVVFGLIGGFVLNLTPCVLPVIPIKVMTLQSHAGESRGRVFVLGGAMALGVVSFWLALAVPVLLLGEAFQDPSAIFGNWYVTLGIGLIIAVMAVGIMGAFEIRLPQRLYAVNPKADTAFGSFMFGVMAGVLGLPCFGFVAGALVPAALGIGGSAGEGGGLATAAVLLLFGSLGVGMAAPYLVLSLFPKALNFLPRTGPGSDLVKRVLGVLMLAAAAFFLGSGIRTLVNDHPWLGDALHWIVLGLLVLAGGLLLAVQAVRLSARPAPKVLSVVLGLALAAVGGLIVLERSASARQGFQAELAAQTSIDEQREQTIQNLQSALADLRVAGVQGASDEALQRLESAAAALGSPVILPGVWNPYSPELEKYALEQGRVVVLDFTADWCLNCKALEAAVLNVDPVRPVLFGEGVVAVKADLTSKSAPGWARLRSLNRTGIPTLAILGPGLEEPLVYNTYTSQTVLSAIEQARGASRSAMAASKPPARLTP